MVGYGVVFLLLGTVCARLYSAYKKGTPTSGHTSHEHDSVAVDDPKVRVVRCMRARGIVGRALRLRGARAQHMCIR